MTGGQKEQIKLAANYLNGISIGLFLVGGISIPVSILQNAQSVLGAVIAIAFSLSCFGISPYIHALAKRRLQRLDRWRRFFFQYSP